MGLNSYWNDLKDKAEDFLATGTFSDVVRNAPLNNDIVDLNADGGNLDQQGGCTSTSQCPAGYACVNGRCKSTWQGPTGGTSGGQWNSAGECDQDDPNSPCNQGGPGGCQSTPTCGDGDPLQPKPEDCCDQKRCCSYGSAASARPGIHCYCGDCPPLKKCNSFCAGYEAANGETGPGCSSGDNGNSCSECTYCFAGECLPKETNKPCWCDGGKECSESGGPCYHCETDPQESNFGSCVYKEENCQDCSTLTNHLCSCNKILAPITRCKPRSEGGKSASTLVREEAARQCAELCKVDPCKPQCASFTRCTDTGTGVAACLPGETQTGTLQAGDETCVFCEACSTDDLPESCKDCDCNCHDDCLECQICAADGTCQPDPACNQYWHQLGYYVRTVDWSANTNCGFGCNDAGTCCEQQSSTEQVVTLSAQLSGNESDSNPSMSLVYRSGQQQVLPGACGSNCGFSSLEAPYYNFQDEDGNLLAATDFRVGTYTNCQSTFECTTYQYTSEEVIVTGYGATADEAYQDALAKAPQSST